MYNAKSLEILRSIVYPSASMISLLKLICLADAAALAYGAAIYAEVKLPDGISSCSLVTAKCRLVKDNIPLNEAQGVLLATKIFLIVQSALLPFLSCVRFCYDSIIATC